MTQRNIVADLHNHSTASDGELSAEELVRKARQAGLRGLSITDHDTLDAQEAALAEGERVGLRVIPGVEASVRYVRAGFTGTLHFLLYFTHRQLQSESFRQALEQLLAAGRGVELVRARVKAINREFGPDGKAPLLSRPLEDREVLEYSDNVTRRHFALALQEKHGLREKEQINRLIGNDSPAYLPSGIAPEALGTFRASHPVLCILAHGAAGSWPGEGHYKEVLPPLETVRDLLPEFLETPGIDGLEVHYPGHSPEHRELLLEIACRKELLVTGGSDCHDEAGRPFGIEGMTEEEFNVFVKKLDALS